MDYRKCIAVFGLWLVPIAALSHTSAIGLGRERGQFMNCPDKSFPVISATRVTSDSKTADLWTCWYDGAPVHTLPLPAPDIVSRVARAGQVFAADAVEVTPLGTQWIRLKSGTEGKRLYVPLAYCRRVAPENIAGSDLPIGRENLGPYDGLPANYRPSDLVAVPSRYCYSDLPQELRAEALEACLQMLDAARRETGLTIKILSAYRSAQTQAYLCRQKIESAGIEQRLVARPGHSEHQLGTAVDLVGDGGMYLLHELFNTTGEGRWLQLNSHRFGFVPSYSRQRALDEGTPYEPWHFRYVGRDNIEPFQADGDVRE